jgi:hypothetical protein
VRGKDSCAKSLTALTCVLVLRGPARPRPLTDMSSLRLSLLPPHSRATRWLILSRRLHLLSLSFVASSLSLFFSLSLLCSCLSCLRVLCVSNLVRGKQWLRASHVTRVLCVMSLMCHVFYVSCLSCDASLVCYVLTRQDSCVSCVLCLDKTRLAHSCQDSSAR